MSTVWETYLAADAGYELDINLVLGRAGHVVSQSHPGKIEDAPSVTCVDVYTEWPNGDTGPTFRMFKNGAVDKGIEVPEPTARPRKNTAAQTAVKELLIDMAKGFSGAYSTNLGNVFRMRDKPGDLESGHAHHYLADHARDVSQILRDMADGL